MKPFEEKDRYEYPLNADSVALDCGGYEGKWAAGIYEKYGCTIHVLEPVKQFFEQIVRRFAGVPRIKLYNWGIGEISGYSSFGIRADSTGAWADAPEPEVVHIKSVEEVFDYLKLDRVDVMKVNIEGGEWEVVPALISSGLILRVANLQVQWHPVGKGSEEKFAALQQRLAMTHSLTFDAGWVWQNWRRCE